LTLHIAIFKHNKFWSSESLSTREVYTLIDSLRHWGFSLTSQLRLISDRNVRFLYSWAKCLSRLCKKFTFHFDRFCHPFKFNFAFIHILCVVINSWALYYLCIWSSFHLHSNIFRIVGRGLLWKNFCSLCFISFWKKISFETFLIKRGMINNSCIVWLDWSRVRFLDLDLISWILIYRVFRRRDESLIFLSLKWLIFSFFQRIDDFSPNELLNVIDLLIGS